MVRPDHQQAGNTNRQETRNAHAPSSSHAGAVRRSHLDHIRCTSHSARSGLQRVCLAEVEIINHNVLRIVPSLKPCGLKARACCNARWFDHANVTDRDARIVFPRVKCDQSSARCRLCRNGGPRCAGRIVLSGCCTFRSTKMTFEDSIRAQQDRNLIEFGVFQGMLERLTQPGGGHIGCLGQVQQVHGVADAHLRPT